MNSIQTYLDQLKEILDDLPQDMVGRVIATLHAARISNHQVFIMGNGGSASTASHFVCDLGKNTRVAGIPDFRVVCLSDNVALFSTLANDHGYENVFTHQLASSLKPGDVVIGISTSGSSPNVVNAIRLANSMEAITITLTGFDSGQVGALADINLHIPSDCIEHVEDTHLVLEHLICTLLRDKAKQTLNQLSQVSVI